MVRPFFDDDDNDFRNSCFQISSVYGILKALALICYINLHFTLHHSWVGWLVPGNWQIARAVCVLSDI